MLVNVDSHARVTGCAIIDNPDVGITTSTGFFEGRGNLVRGNGIGVRVADGSRATVAHPSDVQVSGCSRAGVLFHASTGTVDRIRSTDNGFGLVLQGSPLPDVVAESCVFAHNADQDVLTDSDLAIPDGSSDLPEAAQ